MTTGSAAELKACCSAAYGGEAARYLLGESFHPGGTELTRALVRDLDLRPGTVLVDVASGLGTSALLAAQETGCDVVGVDLSSENVAEATGAARAAGVHGRVRFLNGDAESLPVADGSADAVLCECSLCLFPDPEAAASEIARILRPGARLALSDVVARPAELEADLRGVAGWASCVANARPLEDVVALLGDAGIVAERVDRHDWTVARTLDRIEGRLRLARAFGAAVPADVRNGAARGLELVASARRAVASGALGYGVVIARRA